MTPIVHGFHDDVTGTVTYVVYEKSGSACAIIDPVLDYDPKAGRTSTASADKVIAFVNEMELSVHWILETHAHADHLSAAPYVRSCLGGKIAIGSHITRVQQVFKKIFNLEPEFRLDGSQFDQLIEEGVSFSIGNLQGEAIHVPGHTPACMAYKVGNAVFVGDTLFMPDLGTARCDFPGGNANTLYRSIQKLLSLAPDTRLFMCHDYPPPTRNVKFESSVAEQRAHNIHIHEGVSEEAFVQMRNKRDATLEMPNLILPSVQVNIRAGQTPPPENNGVSYLKIPLNQL
ncbi:MAG TPA: MBL fold metallo-hydrolase [Pusillimonas sp.]|jgi:glyoxylase-like metal-dependent hydrolase (beta-lactamase superfamily II)|nr:MBL fold metallo-hydrolase [Pusillimonas sp.]|tara:strand:+ start:147834 stop:148694 length:861 start_codon:yes stop_codon:yes gene_type:complete